MSVVTINIPREGYTASDAPPVLSAKFTADEWHTLSTGLQQSLRSYVPRETSSREMWMRRAALASGFVFFLVGLLVFIAVPGLWRETRCFFDKNILNDNRPRVLHGTGLACDFEYTCEGGNVIPMKRTRFEIWNGHKNVVSVDPLIVSQIEQGSLCTCEDAALPTAVFFVGVSVLVLAVCGFLCDAVYGSREIAVTMDECVERARVFFSGAEMALLLANKGVTVDVQTLATWKKAGYYENAYVLKFHVNEM